MAQSPRKRSPLWIVMWKAWRSWLHLYCDVSSCPLPEKRDRIWILGSRDATFPAATWAEEVESLESLCKELRGLGFRVLGLGFWV